MITKKSSYLILMAFLLFPIVIFAADDYYPIIFVHGQQADGEASTGVKSWNPSDPEQQTAMKKIIGYEGYQYGLKSDNTPAVDCDEGTRLKNYQGTKRIFNFSYYHTDGSPGAIGSNWYLVPCASIEGAAYANNISHGTWAENLKDFISRVCGATGANKVDIVAHSMGGLVTKSAITYYGCGSKVRKFLMVGTPNHGIEADWKVCAALDLASHWEPWLHLGEGLELGVDKELEEIRVHILPPRVEFTWGAYYNTEFQHMYAPYETGGWCKLLNDKWEEKIQNEEIDVDFSIITGDRNPFSLFGYSGTNDGVLKKSWCVPVEGSSFEPTIYASHSHMDAIAGGLIRKSANRENALPESDYTTEFIKKWIIDDDETHTSAQIYGIPRIIYDDFYWPNNDDKYCGSIRIKIPVADYSDVLSVTAEVHWNTLIDYYQGDPPLYNEGPIVSLKGIPVYRCSPQTGMGEYVSIVLEPGMFDTYDESIYTIYFRINDMEHGEIDEQKLTVIVDDISSFPEYNGEKVTGSFVDVFEPGTGSYIPGNTMHIAWVSNENVLSRKIYFSGNGGNTYIEMASCGERGKDLGFGEAWWREDHHWLVVPTAASDQCKIKVVENIDNITFVSGESETFSIPGDVVLQDITVLFGKTKTYQGYNTITASDFMIQATGLDGANVTMAAGDTVYLKTGFKAKEGCYFHAYTDPSIRWDYGGTTSASLETKPLSFVPEPEKSEKDSTKISTELSSKESIPTVFSCAQNYPNPFMGNTTIKYGLPRDSKVHLCIYNLIGQRVKTLVEAQQSAGYKSVTWDGRTSGGKEAPKGVYFYTFEAGDYKKHHKMILVK